MRNQSAVRERPARDVCSIQWVCAGSVSPGYHMGWLNRVICPVQVSYTQCVIWVHSYGVVWCVIFLFIVSFLSLVWNVIVGDRTIHRMLKLAVYVPETSSVLLLYDMAILSEVSDIVILSVLPIVIGKALGSFCVVAKIWGDLISKSLILLVFIHLNSRCLNTNSR